MRAIHLLLLIMVTSSVFAQGGGIQALNYNVSLRETFSDRADSTGLSAELRIPATRYTGLILDLGYIDQDSNEGTIEIQTLNYGFRYLVRSHDLGFVRVYYSNVDVAVKIGQTNRSDFDTQVQATGISMGYYLQDFTLQVRRYITKQEDSDIETNGFYVGATYFVTDNLGLDFLAGGMDVKDRYHLEINYQPTVFNNSTIVNLGYTEEDGNESYRLGLVYAFATAVDYKTRRRKY